MWLFAPKAKKTLRVAADRLWTAGEEQAASHKSTPRCNISQERSDHYDLQTSLQAVVTYNQLLAAQFAGVRDPLLVKACREGGARQRQTMRNWGKGQAWMLQQPLWKWTWMSCKDATLRQLLTERLSSCTYFSCAILAAVFILSCVLLHD